MSIFKNANKIQCECIKDYLFNRTENFPGVLFEKYHYYGFKGPDTRYKNTELVAVINHDEMVYVGMSINRFNKHFVVILDSNDIENKTICNSYNINFRT